MKSAVTHLLLLSLFFATSCKVRERIVEVEKEVVKTEYRDRLQRDSIYLHDSVFVHARNDTVFFYKNRYLYRDKVLRDTVNVVDSIYIEKPLRVEVPVNVLTKWQRWRLNALNIILLLMLLYVVWRVSFRR